MEPEQDTQRSSSQSAHIGVKVLILNYGKVLLGKHPEADSDPEQGKWDLIGGSMHLNEDLQAAVKREVLKDCGWEVANIRLFKINVYSTPDTQDGQQFEVVFVVDAVGQSRVLSARSKELRWFMLTSLPEPEEIVSEHAESIYELVKLVHGGKTLELNRLPPLFTLKKAKKISALLMPPSPK